MKNNRKSNIKIGLLALVLISLGLGVSAQDIPKTLVEIEKNNTSLQAYKKLNEAEKLENKTGIYLENPEVEFNYLWGDPASKGERKDFAIKQSFDFPTAYGIRKKIANARNQQSDLAYQLQRKTVLYRAKTLCNELIYLNARNTILASRVKQAKELAEACTIQFEKGEINILDKNKAQFNLLNAQKELEANQIERDNRLAMLTTLNGGKAIDFNQIAFEKLQLPADFATWYNGYQQKNLLLQQNENDIQISEKEIQLSKAMSLPKFSGGYMSESVVGESFRGVSVGMSIPLWENKNKVKLAKARKQVAVEQAKSQQFQTLNQLKGQYDKAVNLKETLRSYEKEFALVNSAELLKTALDAGEISLIDYLQELTLYYETTDKFLTIEKELNQLAAGLFFFEL